jgi:hypothetical protein
MDINGQKHVIASVPQVTNSGTHRVGRWLFAIAGLEVLKTLSLPPAGIRTPNRPARSIVTILTDVPHIPNKL